jgi:hypothetical protein
MFKIPGNEPVIIGGIIAAGMPLYNALASAFGWPQLSSGLEGGIETGVIGAVSWLQRQSVTPTTPTH